MQVHKSADYLHQQIQLKKSFLCVGLDPDIKKLPKAYQSSDKPLYSFCKDVIEASHEFAIAYKINIAFFESHGPAGWQQLEELVKLIPDECLIIADAKRADIGNTSDQYAHYYFEKLNVDAITLHPYMGLDSLEPFLNYKDKWSIILGLTSNPGSQDFELQKLENGEPLYKLVMKKFINSDYNSNIMFVCGATHPEEFAAIRIFCPDHFLLVPGIGAQGGDLQTLLNNGKNNKGGLLINVSRSICYPEAEKEFKKAVAEAASHYQSQMSSYI